MKKRYGILGLALSTLILVGCGNTQSKTAETTEVEQVEQVMNVSTVAPISSLDTTQTTDKNTFTMAQHLFEGLTRLNAESEVVPGLAETIDISEDGLTYTFKLKENAKWSNGDPITSEDFEYAWKRLVDPDTQGPNAYLLDNVKNSLAIRLGELPVSDMGISAPDEETFIVELENPQPSFLTVTAITWLAPQQEKYVNQEGSNYATTSDNLIYSGPFILNEWDGTSDEWVLEKNAEYYDADVVNLDKVNVQTIKEEATGINLYEAKDLDLVKISGQNVAQYSGVDGYITSLDIANQFLDFNQAKDRPTSNFDLRKAIALSVDKEALAQNVLNDGAASLNGLIPSNLYQNPETGEDYREFAGDFAKLNLEEAKGSWKKAQKELGDKVTLELLAADTDSGKKVSEYLKGTLEEELEGLTINVVLQPSNNVNQTRRDRDYDVSLSGWIAGSNEMDSYFNLYADGSAYNYAQFVNPEYTTLVTNAKTIDANSPNKQFESYKQAEDILLNQTYSQVPLYQTASNYLVQPNIENVEYPLYGGYFYLRNAEVK